MRRAVYRIVKPVGQIVTADRDHDVVDAVMKWSEDVIEQPHEMFAGPETREGRAGLLRCLMARV